MSTKIGTNIKIIDREDRITIVIAKDVELKESESGKSYILAKTNRFESVGEVCGDLAGYEIGLNMIVTARKKKAVKKKKPRLDDDDEA